MQVLWVLTIATVLKTGDFKNGTKTISYSPAHVVWLKSQIRRHITLPHRFVCLSDINIPDCEVIPLKHAWPGWWSKIELFRPNIFNGPVFYLDLDTVITQNINNMVKFKQDKYFLVLKNLFQGEGFGSGLMAWAGDFSKLYDIFKSNPVQYMREYSKSIYRWGDQAFLQEHLSGTVYFQDLFPGQIISYLFGLRNKSANLPPANCKIVCFHGKPKPWDIKAEWIPKMPNLAGV